MWRLSFNLEGFQFVAVYRSAYSGGAMIVDKYDVKEKPQPENGKDSG